MSPERRKKVTEKKKEERKWRKEKAGQQPNQIKPNQDATSRLQKFTAYYTPFFSLPNCTFVGSTSNPPPPKSCTTLFRIDVVYKGMGGSVAVYLFCPSMVLQSHGMATASRGRPIPSSFT
jgi:hypothetical protein